jgi:mersacidin/lichenicidin family type 2 lantibiotic
MKHLDVIRAGKDAEYRLTLSDAERALLPAQPAGLMELTDLQLDQVQGGLGLFGGVVAVGVIALGAAILFKNIFAGSGKESPPSVPYPGYKPPIMA